VERVSGEAMIASHEIDHLEGHMLVDRLSDEVPRAMSQRGRQQECEREGGEGERGRGREREGEGQWERQRERELGRDREHDERAPLAEPRCGTRSEKDAKLAQRLGQLQPVIAVSPQECVGQLPSFGPS
jgi:hypothetical protein